MGPTAKFDDVSRRVERGPKREDDGREGAISGRFARKATGVSPFGFARTGVFAGNFTDCHWDAPAGDTGDSGDAGAPGKRATGELFRRPTRREPEGGGRGQRRSRRATDGAQGVRASFCVFAENESVNTNQLISEALHGAPRDAGAPGKRATERVGAWGGAPPRIPISRSANQRERSTERSLLGEVEGVELGEDGLGEAAGDAGEGVLDAGLVVFAGEGGVEVRAESTAVMGLPLT